MVFVLSKNKKPLAPTSKVKARILLKKGKDIVHKIFPFTIRLKENKECQKSFEIKFYVGSSIIGVANVINFAKKYSKLIPINSIVVERVSFDISSMTQDRKLYGVEYQNGELNNKKPREYIFAKNNNRCAYCGKKGQEIDLLKEHYFDAMCIGDRYQYKMVTNSVLEIKAQGRRKREVCLMDRFGFPKTKVKKEKIVKGFQTDDIVKAVVTKGKKLGTYLGKVAVQSGGYFIIITKLGTIQGINHKYCKTIQKGDGYAYATIKI